MINKYSEGDYILCMMSRLLPFILLTLLTLTYFTPQFGREDLVQRRAILLSPQCGDTTSCIRHLVSHRLLSLNSKENVQNVR